MDTQFVLFFLNEQANEVNGSRSTGPSVVTMDDKGGRTLSRDCLLSPTERNKSKNSIKNEQ